MPPAPPRPSASPAPVAASPTAAGPTPAESALPLLAIAGFGSMVAMRLCDAMLPALGASFGVPAAQASVAVSAFAIAYGLMQLVAGPLGDRFGKPQVVAAAAALCGLAALAASQAPDLAWLALGRTAMGGAAAGIIPLTMAWIGDHVPWERRQVGLARLLSYTVLGMITGSWAGGVVAQHLGWRWGFVAVGLLLLGAAVAIARRAGGRAGPLRGGAASPWAQAAGILRDPAARRLYAVTAAEGALVFGIVAFVPSLLHQRFGLPLSQAGGVLALFGLGGFAYARAVGWLLRRWQAAQLAASGGGLLCVAFLALAWAPQAAWSLPASALAGLGFYLLHGGLQTRATQLSAQARGTAVSLFACVLFIGQSAGVAWMAAVFARGGITAGLVTHGLALLALGRLAARELRAPARTGG